MSSQGMRRPHNISLYPGTGSVEGRLGDHILIAPAYNVTEEEIRLIVDKTASVIEGFFTDMRASDRARVDEAFEWSR